MVLLKTHLKLIEHHADFIGFYWAWDQSIAFFNPSDLIYGSCGFNDRCQRQQGQIFNQSPITILQAVHRNVPSLSLLPLPSIFVDSGLGAL